MILPKNWKNITKFQTVSLYAFNVFIVGKHYLKQWAEEDFLLYEGHALHGNQVKGEYIENEDTIVAGDVGLGSLSEKVVSAFVPEANVPDVLMDEDNDIDTNPLKPRNTGDIVKLEDRLRNELALIGLAGHHENRTSSDEITNELVRLQGELKKNTLLNQSRKDLMRPVVEKWMAHQEYNALVDDINKNIQSIYSKKYIPMKKAKKEGKCIPEGTLLSLRARKRLLEEIGGVFYKQKVGEYEESLFDVDDVLD
jgi:hypothetical protein